MATTATQNPSTATPQVTHKQIRGSSLLLAGRFLASGINFAAQVLLARYLSTTEYGALAYALAVVSLCQVFCTLGLQKAIPRFVPIYEENREYGKLLGTILMAAGIVFAMVLALGVFVSTAGTIAFGALIDDTEALALLSIAVFLIPVQAADDILVGFFAGLARPRAIFLRKHVLGPALKFTVVLLLIGLHANVAFVAYGYLFASAAGVLLYGVLMVRLLQREKRFQSLWLSKVRIPAKELFSFSIPLLTSEIVAGAVLCSVAIFLLASYGDVSEAAFYRVAVAPAHLNLTVLQSFSILYTPLAARLFARSDYDGISQLYWSTTAWMAVLTFPIFIATFSLAKPLTLFLYGSRYEASDAVLAWLSLGYYVNAALGLNSQTLRVCGDVRYILRINLLSAVIGVAIIWLLIPPYGALGAAIGTAGTLMVRNIFTQIGLVRLCGLTASDRRHLPIYFLIALSATGLLALQISMPVNEYLMLALACAAVVAVFLTAKTSLRVTETFPELLKLPLVRAIFA
jgi:O-antigen/teichoic acid export membrane protein